LADSPFGDVGSNSDYVARRFVPQSAVSVINLRHLSGVQIAPADPAQLYFDDDLIRSQRWARPFLEGNFAFSG